MKHILFFPHVKEYRDYVHQSIVTNKEFHNAPFYKGLVNFIIDRRTPIFFKSSHEYERSHFTQYFNFSLLRDEYDNSYISDLYYIHDFVHMLFYNPLEPRTLSFQSFVELAISNEYFAANETEILTYYRLPGLRKKTFKELIMYDVLHKKVPSIPHVNSLYQLRKSIIEQQFVETFFLNHPEEKRIIGFLKKFNGNNQVWCRLWYDQFPSFSRTQVQMPVTLTYEEYPKVLESYTSSMNNDKYKQNILYNTRILLEMLESENLPETFEECQKALLFAEDKVVMQAGAKHFYDTFINSKKNQ